MFLSRDLLAKKKEGNETLEAHHFGDGGWFGWNRSHGVSLGTNGVGCNM